MTAAILPWFVTTIGLLVLIGLASNRSAQCGLSTCYCEDVGADFFMQAANGWSSVAFIGIGGLVGLHARNRDGLEWILFGVLVALIGVGSMFFHGFMTVWSSKLDGICIEIFLWFLLVIGTERLTKKTKTLVVWILGWIVIIILEVFVPDSFPMREVLFGTLLSSVFVIETIDLFRTIKENNVKRRIWYLIAVICVTIAFIFFMLSRGGSDALCHVEGLGHSIWHVFAALAAGAMYMYEVASDTGKEGYTPLPKVGAAD